MLGLIFFVTFAAIVRIIIGSNEYRQWGEGLLHAVQYKKINRYAFVIQKRISVFVSVLITFLLQIILIL